MEIIFWLLSFIRVRLWTNGSDSLIILCGLIVLGSEVDWRSYSSNPGPDAFLPITPSIILVCVLVTHLLRLPLHQPYFLAFVLILAELSLVPMLDNGSF